MNNFEIENVMVPYEKINQHFNKTRVFLWPATKAFLDSIPNTDLVIDIGCGNGRDINQYKFPIIGCDICFPVLEQARNSNGFIGVLQGNALHLPFGNNTFDKLISIAVIHHLSDEKRRRESIKEFIRIIKPGGKLFIQVWAYEQPKDSRRKFIEGDNMVPWVLYGKYLQRTGSETSKHWSLTKQSSAIALFPPG